MVLTSGQEARTRAEAEAGRQPPTSQLNRWGTWDFYVLWGTSPHSP